MCHQHWFGLVLSGKIKVKVYTPARISGWRLREPPCQPDYKVFRMNMAKKCR